MIVDNDKLREITGYKQDSMIESCLSKQGIKTFYSKKGIWTTIGLIENAGVVSGNKAALQPDIEIL
jgi:hypothetical protein|tara:strand:- start:1409 stop:1606 length:198 start_codon:yes stop_codon:yes gene_type:complete